MNSLEAKSKEYIQGKVLLLTGMRERNKSMKNQQKKNSFFRMFQNTPILTKGTIDTLSEEEAMNKRDKEGIRAL